MLPLPRAFAWVLCSIVVLVAAAALTTVSADEHVASLPHLVTSTLQPGDNQVGWVLEPMPVQELFARVPQIELIFAWNARWGRYEVAAPRLPQPLWTVYALEPGKSYRVRLSGQEAIDWQRPISPASGLVRLSAGVNWTAWAGADGWTIADVAKGIGNSLRSIRVGTHSYDPSRPETTDNWPLIDRGTALEVSVSRDVIWLQPTFVAPELDFVGDIPPEIQREIEQDLADVLQYSAQELGIQADRGQMLVVVANSARAAFDRLEELGREGDWEHFVRRWTETGGWYDPELKSLQLAASDWTGFRIGPHSNGRYTLMREYFHVLQHQLSEGGASRAPVWITEGTAAWVEADLRSRDGIGQPLSQQFSDVRDRLPMGPTLESTAQINDGWERLLGLLATDLLVEQHEATALLDYFRSLASNPAGPTGHWRSNLSGAAAFAATFGVSVEEFYAEFEAHEARWRGAGPRQPQMNEVIQRGRLVRHNGEPIEGAWLRADQTEHGRIVDDPRWAETDANGEFAIYVQRRAEYQILLQLADHESCQHWLSIPPEKITNFHVGANDPEPLQVSVEDERCRQRISGRLVGPDNEPMPGFRIEAFSEVGTESASNGQEGLFEVVTTTSGVDGSFEFVAPRAGSYRLFADLGECHVHLRTLDATGNREEASDIQVLDQNVSNIVLKVTDDPCLSLNGRLVNADGIGLEGVNIYAQADADPIGTFTDTGGYFTLPLSEPGVYALYGFLDGCVFDYRDASATGILRAGTPITVSDSHVDRILVRIPEDFCVLRVSGRILNADGSPVTMIWVGASGDFGAGGQFPSSDGEFSFLVPLAGAYNLWVTIDNCAVYYAGDGAAGNELESRVLNLLRSDVAGIEFRLPENPSSVCE